MAGVRLQQTSVCEAFGNQAMHTSDVCLGRKLLLFPVLTVALEHRINGVGEDHGVQLKPSSAKATTSPCPQMPHPCVF